MADVKQFVDNMEFKYRKDEYAKSLISEYQIRKFRSQKNFCQDKKIFFYYEDANDDNRRHGIGTLNYDNGFRYNVMLEND